MKKQIVRKRIFKKSYDGIITGIRFSDLPKDMQPDDIIDIEKIEAYNGTDSSYDAFSELKVYRELEETDKEFEARKKMWDGLKAKSKADRYNQYLKLKEEFDVPN